MRREKREMEKPSSVVFFDADGTLWQIVSQSDNDYASKGAFEGKNRTIKLTKEGEAVRLEDGARFYLKRE